MKIRISLKWFHLDIGMIARVQIFDNHKQEFIAEWNVQSEKQGTLRHFPLQPHKTLPPAHQKYYQRATDLANAYLAGYREDQTVHSWIPEGDE